MLAAVAAAAVMEPLLMGAAVAVGVGAAMNGLMHQRRYEMRMLLRAQICILG